MKVEFSGIQDGFYIVPETDFERAWLEANYAGIKCQMEAQYESLTNVDTGKEDTSLIINKVKGNVGTDNN